MDVKRVWPRRVTTKISRPQNHRRGKDTVVTNDGVTLETSLRRGHRQKTDPGIKQTVSEILDLSLLLPTCRVRETYGRLNRDTPTMLPNGERGRSHHQTRSRPGRAKYRPHRLPVTWPWTPRLWDPPGPVVPIRREFQDYKPHYHPRRTF